jgi:hypothetical protein
MNPFGLAAGLVFPFVDGGPDMTLSAFKLSLPTDIPWKRICVTEDMIDPAICDRRFIPKWNSSMAVFQYVPPDEYQMFEDVKVTYLKVTVTITGFQPLSEEIQGQIDWDGLDLTTFEELTDMLNTYHPCYGALLQVSVAPTGRRSDVPLGEYPYFMDFEPKKRELYELATDTKEKQSRSSESLNVTKSAGTALSQEIMDIDMGGGGFGANASYAGTGGGFTYTAPSGQWGTKSMNTDQSQQERTTDVGTEKRESHSFSTQISQMYHQLDSYHLGTNRALFFVQPRPHVLEEPSGFVRGPRKVEGIQEFFLIVGQSRKQERPFCVSVRLDTSHIIEADILDYEERYDTTNLASAVARIATRNDQPAGTTTRRACFIDCWDVTYNCFSTTGVDDVIYNAPAGFVITGWSDLVNQDDHGSSSVSVAPGNRNLTVHAEAHGHICYEGSGVCIDCPDEVDKWSGWARRQVQVHLRSEEPTKKIGTEQKLLVTTRGLCCCPEGGVDRIKDGIVTGIYEIPLALGGRRDFVTVRKEGSAFSSRAGAAESAELQPIPIRQANALTEYIHDRMIQSVPLDRPGFEPKIYIETDLFLRKFNALLRQNRVGRQRLGQPAAEFLPRDVVKTVAKYLNVDPKEVKAGDVFRVRTQELTREAGIDSEALARWKLRIMGVQFRKRDDDRDKDTYQQAA